MLYRQAAAAGHPVQRHQRLRQLNRVVARRDDERREILRWLFYDNHKFTSYFATYRFMKAFGPAAPDAAVMTKPFRPEALDIAVRDVMRQRKENPA